MVPKGLYQREKVFLKCKIAICSMYFTTIFGLKKIRGGECQKVQHLPTIRLMILVVLLHAALYENLIR